MTVAVITGGFGIVAILIQQWFGDRTSRSEHAQNAKMNDANTQLISTVLQTMNTNRTASDNSDERIESKLDDLNIGFQTHLITGHAKAAE